MKSRLVFALAILAFAAVAAADSWQWRARTDVFEFGDGLRFEYRVRPFDGGRQAHTEVVVEKQGKRLAGYSEMGFDRMYAAPDNGLFVAISNSGLPGTAVAVFAANGELWLYAKHDVADFDYCERSITVVRAWFDDDNPDVQFDAELGLSGITLTDCHGKRINLQDTVAAALAHGAENARESAEMRAAVEERRKTGEKQPGSTNLPLPKR
jgi:hypothetical protein